VKIILACGGTGGHIFPAFSVAEELKRRQPSCQIIYACGKKDIESSIFKIVRDEKVISVQSAPFGGRLSLLNPVFLLKLTKGFLQSFFILMKERPQIVVGFGGYFSFPVILVARLLGIRTLIHEQNVAPGVANVFLSRWVDGVALSFAETGTYFSRVKNTRVTGNPIRSSVEKDRREEALSFFKFSRDKVTVLVLGGSQGAESINTLFLEGLFLLSGELKTKVQVLHLCGRMSVETVEAALKAQGVDGRVFSFFERMDLAYGACDFAIGRAGATFLAEIAVKKIPSILIPYPYGDGHQRLNAKAHSQGRECVVAEQKELTPVILAGLLTRFIKNEEAKSERVLNGSKNIGGNGHHRFDSMTANSRVLLADFIEEVRGMP